MPHGPSGQWRPANAIEAAIMGCRIATGDIAETYAPPGREPSAKVKARMPSRDEMARKPSDGHGWPAPTPRTEPSPPPGTHAPARPGDQSRSGSGRASTSSYRPLVVTVPLASSSVGAGPIVDSARGAPPGGGQRRPLRRERVTSVALIAAGTGAVLDGNAGARPVAVHPG